MSFLAPLYIAGLAAVSLPILFHMIRRTPRGRTPFSSVMFLEPSPPRITRRSRLDNWPLLLLRALALCLLAAAFGRPFLRETVGIGVETSKRKRTAIIVDTSASMRRGNLWKKAAEQANTIIKQSAAADQAGLFTFDRKLTTILSFEEWKSLKPSARVDLARQRLEKTSPGWAATDLGQALVTAAEMLESQVVQDGGTRDPAQKEIILITDLQLGSRLDALGTYEWPKDVRLSIKRIKARQTTNAGLQLVADTAIGTDNLPPRVRVTNAADSTREQFQLHWLGDVENSIDVYVPSGRSRVVRAPAIPKSATPLKLTLEGDDHDFDNVIYVDHSEPESVAVLYYGSEPADDVSQPRYYVERAFPKTARRTVTVIAQAVDAPLLLPAEQNVRLVIVTGATSAAHAKRLRRYVRDGGTLLLMAKSADDLQSFGQLVGNDKLSGTEANVDGYAMLADIDFSHPVFAPFAEAHFADFTQIHVWKHRKLSDDSLSDARVLARFDDGDPAILEIPVGDGRILLFTLGWHPQDSQLALSTKFVPLLNGILDYNTHTVGKLTRYTVGDAVPLQKAPHTLANATSVRRPDRKTIQLASGQTSFTDTVLPGVYTVSASQGQPRFAVNLSADESKTSPLPVEELESLGVQLTGSASAVDTEQARNRERQLMAQELEQHQKMWRWLIAAAIAVLLLETWLAGRMARPQPETVE